MDEVWTLEALERTPSAWLSEVVVDALAWQGAELDPGWCTWVHAAWPAGSHVPEGFEVRELHSEVKEVPFLLGRTSAPSPDPVGPALEPGMPQGAEALVTLTPAYLSALPECLHPVFVPASTLFPLDLPGGLVPPPHARQPVVVGTGCAVGGESSVLARLLAPTLPHGDLVEVSRELLPAGLDLSGEGGVVCFEPASLPLPWVRTAVTGRSGVEEDAVPAGPDLPLLSTWLSRLLVASDGSRQEWTQALGVLDLWAEAFPSWEAVWADQRSARTLGDLVARPLALRCDVNLLATVVLSDTPSPRTPHQELESSLSWGRRRDLARTLARHPDHARWLGPDRPQHAPRPWR